MYLSGEGAGIASRGPRKIKDFVGRGVFAAGGNGMEQILL